MSTKLTDQQAAAFRQLPSIRLVGPLEGEKAVLVKLSDGALFKLSAAGLLSRYRT